MVKNHLRLLPLNVLRPLLSNPPPSLLMSCPVALVCCHFCAKKAPDEEHWFVTIYSDLVPLWTLHFTCSHTLLQTLSEIFQSVSQKIIGPLSTLDNEDSNIDLLKGAIFFTFLALSCRIIDSVSRKIWSFSAVKYLRKVGHMRIFYALFYAAKLLTSCKSASFL
jgi:hypothetical protein